MKKTGRRPKNAFPPGNNLNPKGRPILNPMLKLVRGLTQEQLAELGKLLLEKNFDELELMANSPNSNILMGMVASSLCKAYRTGDWEKAEALMSRIIGKPRENFDITLKGAESFAQFMAIAAGKVSGNGSQNG